MDGLRDAIFVCSWDQNGWTFSFGPGVEKVLIRRASRNVSASPAGVRRVPVSARESHRRSCIKQEFKRPSATTTSEASSKARKEFAEPTKLSRPLGGRDVSSSSRSGNHSAVGGESSRAPGGEPRLGPGEALRAYLPEGAPAQRQVRFRRLRRPLYPAGLLLAGKGQWVRVRLA